MPLIRDLANGMRLYINSYVLSSSRQGFELSGLQLLETICYKAMKRLHDQSTVLAQITSRFEERGFALELDVVGKGGAVAAVM